MPIYPNCETTMSTLYLALCAAATAIDEYGGGMGVVEEGWMERGRDVGSGPVNHVFLLTSLPCGLHNMDARNATCGKIGQN